MLFHMFELGQYRDFDISETFDTVKIRGTLTTSLRDFVDALAVELAQLSARDYFELLIDAGGNNVRLNDAAQASVSSFLVELEDYLELQNYDVVLDIQKRTVEKITSIYFLKKFFSYVNSEELMAIFGNWSDIFSENQIFEIYHEASSFYTKTISFYSITTGEAMPAWTVVPRDEKLNLLSDNSTTVNIFGKFIPDDFSLLVESSLPEVNDFFSKCSSVLCLAFMSNFSRLDGNLFSYKINGYKSIICNDVESSQLKAHSKILNKIYEWAYSGGGNSDKVGLIRNVFSIHVDASGGIKFDSDLWDAIQSNYQIYLKRNIQSYLEIKNKLGEFIVESTGKTYALADQILDSFKNNVLIILTFILTVVVINGLKDSGEVTVFSNAYLGIVVILSLVSCVWLLFTRFEVVKRFDSASVAILKVLKINYGQILMENEIDESINPVIEINRAYLTDQIRRYTYWWLAMLAVFLITFFVCNRIFATPQKTNNVASGKTAASASDVVAPVKRGSSEPPAPNSSAEQVVAEKVKPTEIEAAKKKGLKASSQAVVGDAGSGGTVHKKDQK